MTASPEKVAAGKVVQFTYRISDRHGDIMEQVDLPLSMVFMRHNRLYDVVEKALVGCRVGDEVSVDVPAADGAWGEADADLILVQDIEHVPPPYRRVGAEAQFQSENGEIKTFKVTNVTEESVTLDANHPFAGQTMTFHVKVIAIRDASKDELLHGIASGAPDSVGGATIH
jgi:FKBP-type peptidyl-prolyl cis-trans isomerase SlyD